MYLGVSGFGLTSAFALSSWFDPRAVPIRFATYAVLATCTSSMFEVDRSGTDGVNGVAYTRVSTQAGLTLAEKQG